MGPKRQLTELIAFIASPGDVEEERRRVREAIAEISEAESSQHHVRVVGHEEASPGFGRPQQIINSELDRCHLFIGILYKRFGSPSGAEGYESGFQEEFERVLARRKASADGEPEIWLFVKDIAPDELRDPGPQLQRTLAFRASLELEKPVFFKSFGDTWGLAKEIRQNLTRHLWRLQRSFDQPTLEVAGSSQLVPRDEHRPTIDKHDSLSAAEIRDAVSALLPSIDRQNPDSQVEDLIEKSLCRSLLYFESWRIDLISNQLIEPHFLNRLYRDRESIHPSGNELRTILRSSIVGDWIPSWYWFRKLSAGLAESLILEFAFADTNNDVAASAILLLREAIPHVASAHLAEACSAAQTAPRSVAKEWLKLLGDLGELGNLEMLPRDSLEGEV